LFGTVLRRIQLFHLKDLDELLKIS
jgi:hypothetical protein